MFVYSSCFKAILGTSSFMFELTVLLKNRTSQITHFLQTAEGVSPPDFLCILIPWYYFLPSQAFQSLQPWCCHLHTTEWGWHVCGDVQWNMVFILRAKKLHFGLIWLENLLQVSHIAFWQTLLVAFIIIFYIIRLLIWSINVWAACYCYCWRWSWFKLLYVQFYIQEHLSIWGVVRWVMGDERTVLIHKSILSVWTFSQFFIF